MLWAPPTGTISSPLLVQCAELAYLSTELVGVYLPTELVGVYLSTELVGVCLPTELVGAHRSTELVGVYLCGSRRVLL